MKYALMIPLATLLTMTEGVHKDPTQKWAVRFQIELKATTDVPDPPLIHVSLLVKAPTEGQAIVTALQFAQRQVTIDAQEKLKYVDCCKKE